MLTLHVARVRRDVHADWVEIYYQYGPYTRYTSTLSTLYGLRASRLPADGCRLALRDEPIRGVCTTVLAHIESGQVAAR